MSPDVKKTLVTLGICYALLILVNLLPLGELFGQEVQEVAALGICVGPVIAAFFGIVYWRTSGSEPAAKTPSDLCPACNRPGGKVRIERSVIDQTEGYSTTTRVDIHRNEQGEEMGSTERTEQVHVILKTYLDKYWCPHCRHRWTVTYKVEEEG